jgi:hypothetical protein
MKMEDGYLLGYNIVGCLYNVFIMISRLFRPSLLPSRLVARSAGGWERPDPPVMVKYENRRTVHFH